MSQPTAVLFVCMGNICRSPAAEGLFRKLVEKHGLNDAITIDSAGTIVHHAGNPPDARMTAAAAKRGTDLSSQRARRFTLEDLKRFDLIVAMDRANLDDLRAVAKRARHAHTDHVRLLGEFAPSNFQQRGGPPDVPDPYYGGDAGFEHVLDLLEAALPNVLEHARMLS